MTFSEQIKHELLEIPVKKNCCRKAMLCGLIYSATLMPGRQFQVSFSMPLARELASDILARQFATEGVAEDVTVVGRRKYTLQVKSKALTSFLISVEHGEAIDIAASFHCDDCAGSFLRGVFIAIATVNHPQKGYHAECALPASLKERMNALQAFVLRCGFQPKKSERQQKVSLYWKSNGSISDILYFIGAVKSGFEYTNFCIENEIRNNENRATNCVATNISKSVQAAQKQLAAIRLLDAQQRLPSLPDDLYETARLRLEYEEATLAELALLHHPPISKSGLNHRLQKICAIAAELSQS